MACHTRVVAGRSGRDVVADIVEIAHGGPGAQRVNDRILFRQKLVELLSLTLELLPVDLRLRLGMLVIHSWRDV